MRFFTAMKSVGKTGLEGNDYVVRDGDVMLCQLNVQLECA